MHILERNYAQFVKYWLSAMVKRMPLLECAVNVYVYC